MFDAYRSPKLLRQVPAVAAFVALLVLGAGGIETAQAETAAPDLAPTAKELFGTPARPQAIALPTGASCDPASVKRAQDQRREMMARVMAQMTGSDGSRGRALPNGHGYRVARNPMRVLDQVEREAAVQRAGLNR